MTWTEAIFSPLIVFVAAVLIFAAWIIFAFETYKWYKRTFK